MIFSYGTLGFRKPGMSYENSMLLRGNKSARRDKLLSLQSDTTSPQWLVIPHDELISHRGDLISRWGQLIISPWWRHSDVTFTVMTSCLPQWWVGFLRRAPKRSKPHSRGQTYKTLHIASTCDGNNRLCCQWQPKPITTVNRKRVNHNEITPFKHNLQEW